MQLSNQFFFLLIFFYLFSQGPLTSVDDDENGEGRHLHGLLNDYIIKVRFISVTMKIHVLYVSLWLIRIINKSEEYKSIWL